MYQVFRQCIGHGFGSMGFADTLWISCGDRRNRVIDFVLLTTCVFKGELNNGLELS